MSEPLPPWQALPEEVRRRVNERFHALFGQAALESTEQARQELLDLSVCRLVEAHQGNVPAAIAAAGASRAGRRLLKAIGEKEADWLAAIARCQDAIDQMLGDQNQLHRSLVIQQLVLEELESYHQRN